MTSALALVTVALVSATNRAVMASSEGRIFNSLETIPRERVGVVLGTAPTIEGRPNLFFQVRIEAAAKLYHSGKIERILVSGDNHITSYNEPTAMKEALIKQGVSANHIVCDFAGFRTLDSIVRAKRVFGLDRCTIIGDDFHLPRELYIASEEGIQAVGYQARPLSRSVAPQTYLRELGARTLVWLDLHIFRTQPKFLGPREEI